MSVGDDTACCCDAPNGLDDGDAAREAAGSGLPHCAGAQGVYALSLRQRQLLGLARAILASALNGSRVLVVEVSPCLCVRVRAALLHFPRALVL